MPSRNSAAAILQTLCSKLITDPVCFQKSIFTKPDYEKEEVRQTFHSIVLLPSYIVKSFFLENQGFFSVSSINISEEGAIKMDISLYLVRK